MKKQLMAAAVAYLALISAPAAQATVVEGIQLPAGVVFDHFEGKATAAGSGQVDLFNFNLLFASDLTTSILTSVANLSDDLEFESVDIDGVHVFTITNGFFSEATLLPVTLAAGNHVMRVQYSSTAAGVTYSGNIAINPVAVPEPASWMVMLVGLGALGMVTRRRVQARVTFA